MGLSRDPAVAHKSRYVIVSVHAAIEDSPWPSPYIRELYHSFIDAGATVVHGHHLHVPQGYETYDEGVIFTAWATLWLIRQVARRPQRSMVIRC